MARARAKSTRPTKFPMADMSLEAQEARIRNHPPPHFDADKIRRGANEAVAGLVLDMLRGFFNFPVAKA